MKQQPLDNHYGDCPLPKRDCPPGPCKCREHCHVGEYSTAGYQRRRDDQERLLAGETIQPFVGRRSL